MDEFKLTSEPLRIHGVDIMYFIYAEDKENNVEYYTKTTDAAAAISKFNDAVNQGWDCTRQAN